MYINHHNVPWCINEWSTHKAIYIILLNQSVFLVFFKHISLSVYTAVVFYNILGSQHNVS